MQKLLLHCCCAPCASHVLDILKDTYEITVLFYNPNIIPQDELTKRKNELFRLIELMNKESDKQIKFLEHESCVNGIKNKWPIKAEDCAGCIRQRLAFTAQIAIRHGFDLFATTLTVSPHKNATLINDIGCSLETNNIAYLPSNFKKQGGFGHSINLSKKYNLYRQNYCGCVPR